MKRTLLIPVAVVLLSFSLPGTAAPQGPSPSELPAVEPGYTVRLTTDEGPLQGRWLPPDGTLLRLEVDGTERTVPLRRIDAVQVRGTRARQGMWIGAASGAAITGLFVGLLAEGLCEFDCGGADEFLFGLAVGGGVGAVGGGILGGVVGSWLLTWRPVWP